MGGLFDFFGSQAGVELLRILDSVFTIVAAIASGKALQNTYQVKKAIGGTIERGVLDSVKALFRRGRRRAGGASATLEQPSKPLIQQIEGLKTTYERNWVQQGITNRDILNRLDRVDPPTRRH